MARVFAVLLEGRDSMMSFVDPLEVEFGKDFLKIEYDTGYTLIRNEVLQAVHDFEREVDATEMENFESEPE